MIGLHLAMAEILQIVDPMCRLAVFTRMAALHWAERYRGPDPIHWDRCDVADKWPTSAMN